MHHSESRKSALLGYALPQFPSAAGHAWVAYALSEAAQVRAATKNEVTRDANQLGDDDAQGTVMAHSDQRGVGGGAVDLSLISDLGEVDLSPISGWSQVGLRLVSGWSQPDLRLVSARSQRGRWFDLRFISG